MKPLLFIIVLLFVKNTIAQISPEHIYPVAAANLYMVDLELSGMKYIQVSRFENDRKIQLYNLDHSIWKTIDCNNFPIGSTFGYDPSTGDMDTVYSYEYDVLYVSENLFDLDGQLEFMFCVGIASFSPSFTGIYNEDGTTVFAESGVFPGCRLNIPQQFRPIYNTASGTKMILSTDEGDAKVYSLAGTLQLNVGNNNVLSASNMTVYPNPSLSGTTTINYELPDGVNEASIVVTDLNGNQVKSMKINKTFQNVIFDNREFASGVYVYHLVVNGLTIESKKVVFGE